ncbi:hypothetical protein XELAEV_18030249mg [Xenopus laevis]|uniref:Uncharacterized protein n=1 Tax=Xenopus laevis TaxID=8355 RepID=A0A974CT66_XENLA|nr:hypothetical protein XELAEV_18030249mg [Xenopus laevis]
MGRKSSGAFSHSYTSVLGKKKPCTTINVRLNPFFCIHNRKCCVRVALWVSIGGGFSPLHSLGKTEPVLLTLYDLMGFTIQHSGETGFLSEILKCYTPQ